jgi:hypothetical protein
MRFEVFTAVKMWIVVWVATPCSYQRLGVMYWLHCQVKRSTLMKEAIRSTIQALFLLLHFHRNRPIRV